MASLHHETPIFQRALFKPIILSWDSLAPLITHVLYDMRMNIPARSSIMNEWLAFNSAIRSLQTWLGAHDSRFHCSRCRKETWSIIHSNESRRFIQFNVAISRLSTFQAEQNSTVLIHRTYMQASRDEIDFCITPARVSLCINAAVAPRPLKAAATTCMRKAPGSFHSMQIMHWLSRQ